MKIINSNLQRHYARHAKHSVRFPLFMSGGRSPLSYRSVEVATEDIHSR